MEEDPSCEICFEKFNRSANLPKKMECCTKIFCLKCLCGIFQRNDEKILCPTCRKYTTSNPYMLQTNWQIFEAPIKCPSCSQGVRNSQLKIVLFSNINPTITCDICTPMPEVEYLQEYLTNLTDEMGYYLTTFSNCNQTILNEKIDSNIVPFVNKIIDPLRTSLIIKLKQKIWDMIQLKANGSFQEVVNQFMMNVSKLEEKYEKIRPITKVSESITDIDFKNILETIDFYSVKIEEIKQTGYSIKKISEEISHDSVCKLRDIINTEEIASFLANHITVQGQNSHEMKDPFTGISYYDHKLKAIMGEIKLSSMLNEEQNAEINRLQGMNTELLDKLNISKRNFDKEAFVSVGYSLEIIN